VLQVPGAVAAPGACPGAPRLRGVRGRPGTGLHPARGRGRAWQPEQTLAPPPLPTPGRRRAAQAYRPAGFRVRLVPYVCGFAVFGSFFLIASLGRDAVYRFFIVLIIISLLYLVYGVHAAEAHDRDLDAARGRARRLASPERCGGRRGRSAAWLPHTGVAQRAGLWQRRQCGRRRAV